MTAYLITFETYKVAVAEISYEKETAQFFQGVKYVRDIVGNTYYVSLRLARVTRDTRVELSRVTTLLWAREKAMSWQEKWTQLVHEIDAAMRVRV